MIDNKNKRFFAFEGIDGCGKSTQIKFLTQKLIERNIQFYETMEPTDSPIGSLIHQIMIGRIKTDNKVIASLFVADRMDHLLNEVNGLYRKYMENITIVSDRYYMSSYAYHSVDMDMDWVISANSECAKIMKPTVNIFIDVDPDVAMERINSTRSHKELFEEKNRLISVRENYYKAFEKLKGKEEILIVNGNKNPEEIFQEIWSNIKQYF